MKKIFFILLLLSGHFISVSQSINKAILEHTKKNYLNLIGNIPEKSLSEYGFNTKAEIKELKFHTVITEYTLINNTLTKTDNYRVIATTKQGTICGLFTVQVKNNKMQVVDYGAKELAFKIDEKLKKIALTQHVSILRVYASQTDYLFDNSLKTEKQLFYKIYDNSVISLKELLTPSK